MTTDFKKGMDYESKNHQAWERLFMGWALILSSFVGLIGVYWTKTLHLWMCIGLFFFGLGNLWVGYSYKKELKKLKVKK